MRGHPFTTASPRTRAARMTRNPAWYVPGDPRAIARGKVGGAKSAERRRWKSLVDWQRRFPGVPAEAARAIYLQGYNSGHQAGLAARRRAR